MEDIGLMPSSTGEPGGIRVGEKMTHYIIPGGRFTEASRTLLEGNFQLTWNDRYPIKHLARALSPVRANAINVIQDELKVPVIEMKKNLEEKQHPRYAEVKFGKKSTREKYRCSGCGTQVWGKPKLDIRCMKCCRDFDQVG